MTAHIKYMQVNFMTFIIQTSWPQNNFDHAYITSPTLSTPLFRCLSNIVLHLLPWVHYYFVVCPALYYISYLEYTTISLPVQHCIKSPALSTLLFRCLSNILSPNCSIFLTYHFHALHFPNNFTSSCSKSMKHLQFLYIKRKENIYITIVLINNRTSLTHDE